MEIQKFFRKMPKKVIRPKNYDLQKQKLDSAKIWPPVSEVLDPLVDMGRHFQIAPDCDTKNLHLFDPHNSNSKGRRMGHSPVTTASD